MRKGVSEMFVKLLLPCLLFTRSNLGGRWLGKPRAEERCIMMYLLFIDVYSTVICCNLLKSVDVLPLCGARQRAMVSKIGQVVSGSWCLVM